MCAPGSLKVGSFVVAVVVAAAAPLRLGVVAGRVWVDHRRLASVVHSGAAVG